ncbi:LVIVD repeat-containing protein [Patescibacteria group bacterium]
MVDNSTTVLDGAYDIKVEGDFAFVASRFDDGVEVLDVSNPKRPAHVNSMRDMAVTALDGACGIYIQDNYVYVSAIADDGLEILSFSVINESPIVLVDGDSDALMVLTPDSSSLIPVFRSSFSDHQMTGIVDAEVVGRYIVVASSQSDSLSVVDIINPEEPMLIGHLVDSDMSGATSLEIKGGLAYIATKITDLLVIVDVRYPENPRLIRSIPLWEIQE